MKGNSRDTEDGAQGGKVSESRKSMNHEDQSPDESVRRPKRLLLKPV